MATTQWTKLVPKTPLYLFVPRHVDLLKEYEQGKSVTEIMPLSSAGIVTARDGLTIHWNSDDIWRTVTNFNSLSIEDARVKYNLGQDTRDWKIGLAQQDLRASGLSKDKLVPILYRPFDVRYTYYTGNSRGFHCMPRGETMRHILAGRNLGLITTRQTRDKWDVLATNIILGHKSLAAYDINTLFPLYLYPDLNKKELFDIDQLSNTPGGRRPNFSPSFIATISAKLNMQFILDGKGNLQETFGPEDIFDYMYAIFHSPAYRARYAEFLKRDFPRLPLTSNPDLFRELCRLGERLVSLHLMEKSGSITTRYPVSGNNVVEKVDYTQSADEPEQGRVWINKTQYFDNVPLEVWEFHVGGYQVCQKWLKDRKGRTLSFDDIRHYQKIVAALAETINLMDEIDETIEMGGGWPIE